MYDACKSVSNMVETFSLCKQLISERQQVAVFFEFRAVDHMSTYCKICIESINIFFHRHSTNTSCMHECVKHGENVQVV